MLEGPPPRTAPTDAAQDIAPETPVVLLVAWRRKRRVSGLAIWHPVDRMRRTLAVALGAAGLVALLVIGLSQTHTSNARPRSAAPSAAEVRAAFAGSPAPLSALHAQANRLLGGSTQIVRARLADLRGYPVVVNKWASWCGPCRAEFPFLQRVSVSLGRQVAFVGIDGADNTGDARGFLRSFPISYPSYEDPSERVSRALGLGSFYPETLFLDRGGRAAYIHQGGYATQAKLEQDIRRYLPPA